ncbi:MAG: hypothetical protein N3D11_12340, partial [Candidatus Sumerlaeia bacterium]|nr:hypothetical protein [Candidatus Sumerlaeia bacterium]
MRDEDGRMRDEGGRMRDEGGRMRDEDGRMRDEDGRMRDEGWSENDGEGWKFCLKFLASLRGAQLVDTQNGPLCQVFATLPSILTVNCLARFNKSAAKRILLLPLSIQKPTWPLAATKEVRTKRLEVRKDHRKLAACLDRRV